MMLTNENAMSNIEQISFEGVGVLVNAPAKINLSVLVGALRDDGFHEIETVMAKVNWFDRVLVEPSKSRGIQLVCKGPYWAPEGKENLCYQACRKICDKYDMPCNIKITLDKQLPAGAGLGSGSSDAAAVLIAVNLLFKLELPGDELRKIAAELGSDVPFFLDGPLAFCCGKGEKIKKLNEIFNFKALLLLPDISVSTKRVYENFHENKGLFKDFSAKINAFIGENRIDLVAKMCANMLDSSCLCLHEKLKQLKKGVESLGIRPLSLSGSGSTLYKIYYNDDINICEQDKCELERNIDCKCVIVSNNRW